MAETKPDDTRPTDVGAWKPGEEITPAMKAMFLTTEHWSLLATRSMTWNEAFSRAGMFLSVLSGAVVALALVAQATAFGEGFELFAMLLLPVVLFVGVATFIRMVEINKEDERWVSGMNILRHAYLEAAPELRPYFITGTTDDADGVMLTFAATPGPGTFIHQFVTTPGMLAVVVGVIAGALAALVSVVLSMEPQPVLGIGVVAFVVTIGLLFLYQYRAMRDRGPSRRPRFPG